MAAAPKAPAAVDRVDASTFRSSLGPFERVLLAGLLAAEPSLRNSSHPPEHWQARLARYRASTRI